ncbi:MAG: hypothetical protein AAF602_12630 [Myxococcota bacterium]
MLRFGIATAVAGLFVSSQAHAATCEYFDVHPLGFVWTPPGGSTTWTDDDFVLEFRDTGWVPPFGPAGLVIDDVPWGQTLQWANGMEIESIGDDITLVTFELFVLSGTAAKVETTDTSGSGLTSTIYPPGFHQVVLQSAVPIGTIQFYDGDNETWIDKLCIQ